MLLHLAGRGERLFALGVLVEEQDEVFRRNGYQWTLRGVIKLLYRGQTKGPVTQVVTP